MDNNSLLSFEKKKILITMTLIIILFAFNFYPFASFTSKKNSAQTQKHLIQNPNLKFSDPSANEHSIAGGKTKPADPNVSDKPSVKTKPTQGRQIATENNFDSTNNLIQWDCRSAIPTAQTENNFIRILIKNCNNSNLQIRIQNITNGYTAEVISTKPNVWTTDFIHLKEGENKIVIFNNLNQEEVHFTVFKQSLISVSEPE